MTRFRLAFATMLCVAAGASVAQAQRSVAAKDVPPGQRPPRGMCRVWIDGVQPGRQPAVTDCATARATAPANSRIIYGDLTPFPGQGKTRLTSRDCTLERTTTTLGDVIFGRRAADRDVDCRVRGERELGAWYQIGRDANGNVLYQRRVRRADGTVVLERARRAANGSMVIIDTRITRKGARDTDDDDRRWANAERKREKALVKAQKKAVKSERKAAKAERKADEREVRASVRAAVRAERDIGEGRGNAKAKGKGKSRD